MNDFNQKLNELDELVASGVMSEDEASEARNNLLAQMPPQQQQVYHQQPVYQQPVYQQVYSNNTSNSSTNVWKVITLVELAIIFVLAILLVVFNWKFLGHSHHYLY